MTGREYFIIGFGILLATGGVIGTLLWRVEFGIVMLFLFGLLLFLLQILQRRSQARLQERMLYLVNAERRGRPAVVQPDTRASEVATKKILGLLHAQQISMEKLAGRLDRNLNGK